MIFETIEFKSPTNCRDFTSQMTTRIRSATNIQHNKIRVLVIGAAGVGKTSIINEFTQKKFIEGFEDAKIEDAGTIIVELLDVEISLISTLRRLAIKTAQAYILVYSLDDSSSFEYITNIKKEIVDMRGEGMPIVVVGNKSDMSDQMLVQIHKTAAVAADWDIPFTAMSLRTGSNIGSVYRHLFCHRTLQKLIDVVSVISATSSNLRRLSLPAGALHRRLPEVDLLSNTLEDQFPTISRHASSQEQSHSKSRLSKMMQYLTGRKVRK